MRVFRDRRDAGRKLAQRLDGYIGKPDVVVLAIPRGGVPVGYEIAIRIRAPLDVLVVRKLGAPYHPEYAMGAIASGGIEVIDRRILSMLDVSPQELEEVLRRERAELDRRERLFRTGRPRVDPAGKTVILVDDGLATGSSMAAAVDALRARKPARIVVAVPIAPPETCQKLGKRADETICLVTPEQMYAVGFWYDDFAQTTDAEVRELLDAARSGGEPWSTDTTNPSNPRPSR